MNTTRTEQEPSGRKYLYLEFKSLICYRARFDYRAERNRITYVRIQFHRENRIRKRDFITRTRCRKTRLNFTADLFRKRTTEYDNVVLVQNYRILTEQKF